MEVLRWSGTEKTRVYSRQHSSGGEQRNMDWSRLSEDHRREHGLARESSWRG